MKNKDVNLKLFYSLLCRVVNTCAAATVDAVANVLDVRNDLTSLTQEYTNNNTKIDF